MDHLLIGAQYLRHHKLNGLIVDTAEYHHYPERAPYRSKVIAAVQIADLLCQQAQTGKDDPSASGTFQNWQNASGWSIICESKKVAERALLEASLERSSKHLGAMLEQFL